MAMAEIGVGKTRTRFHASFAPMVRTARLRRTLCQISMTGLKSPHWPDYHDHTLDGED